MNKKSVFFCVGSGGHVFPVKNIILDLIKNGVSKEEIIIFTDKRGEEFTVANVEMWALTPHTSLEPSVRSEMQSLFLEDQRKTKTLNLIEILVS